MKSYEDRVEVFRSNDTETLIAWLEGNGDYQWTPNEMLEACIANDCYEAFETLLNHPLTTEAVSDVWHTLIMFADGLMKTRFIERLINDPRTHVDDEI